jgi:hypothetical protein
VARQSINQHREPAEEEEETVKRTAKVQARTNRRLTILNQQCTVSGVLRLSSADMDSNHNKTIDNKIQLLAYSRTWFLQMHYTIHYRTPINMNYGD